MGSQQTHRNFYFYIVVIIPFKQLYTEVPPPTILFSKHFSIVAYKEQIFPLKKSFNLPFLTYNHVISADIFPELWRVEQANGGGRGVEGGL